MDDRSRMSDDLEVTVTGPPVEQVPDRPADGAPKAKWAEHAVALGLDPAAAEDWTRGDIVAWVDGG